MLKNEERSDQISQEQEAMKEKIANALMLSNPRLERFMLDYEEIAKFEKISIDEARRKYTHIELNPPEGDNAIQITIETDHVSVTTPYWYEGDEARGVFKEISTYLRLIRKEAGYFVYDPQNEIVFDPETHVFDNLDEYERIVRKLPDIVEQTMRENEKPWWKFW